MSIINYDHASNLHSSVAPSVITKLILEQYPVSSVLDVGCGNGVWLREFINLGIEDCLGIDGIPIENREFFGPSDKFKCLDLRRSWNLDKKFSLAICLEVAEHLPIESAHKLVKSLCAHSDLVIFSAACPHQFGQGHINCQWPSYWQDLFNKESYTCDDALRLRIWQNDFPEYWYKQNIFIATRDKTYAGKESRIPSFVHSELYELWINKASCQEALIYGELGIKISVLQALKMISNSIKFRLKSRQSST